MPRFIGTAQSYLLYASDYDLFAEHEFEHIASKFFYPLHYRPDIALTTDKRKSDPGSTNIVKGTAFHRFTT